MIRPGTIGENPWLARPAVIRRVQREVDGVATYDLAFVDAEEGQQYHFEPGQFNMLYLPGAGEIPISLSGDATAGDGWPHTIRVAGVVTRALERLGVGGMLGLRGPFGNAWPIESCWGQDVIVVGGGIGLAPLRPAIYHLLDGASRCQRLTFLYGARSPDMLLYRDQYADWSRRGLAVEVTVDRAAPSWTGNVGVVSLLLERLALADPAQAVVLTCGPEVMMRYVVAAALERGIPPERIWLSLERNMQCAVGMCGHCQLGPEFVCQDGPVFRYDRIAPLLAVEAL